MNAFWKCCLCAQESGGGWVFLKLYWYRYGRKPIAPSLACFSHLQTQPHWKWVNGGFQSFPQNRKKPISIECSEGCFQSTAAAFKCLLYRRTEAEKRNTTLAKYGHVQISRAVGHMWSAILQGNLTPLAAYCHALFWLLWCCRSLIQCAPKGTTVKLLTGNVCILLLPTLAISALPLILVKNLQPSKTTWVATSESHIPFHQGGIKILAI